MSQLYYLRIMNFIIFFSLDLQEQSARLYFLFSRVLSEYFSVLNEYLFFFQFNFNSNIWFFSLPMEELFPVVLCVVFIIWIFMIANMKYRKYSGLDDT